MIYWFYGQPGAGKTTLAKALEKQLLKKDPSLKTIIIDGDETRAVFNNKDYTPEGRRKNMKTITDIIRFLYNKNFTVIVSVVAPYLVSRDEIKDLNPLMVYLWTDMIRGREHYRVEDMEIGGQDYQLRTDELDKSKLILKFKSIEKCLEEINSFLKKEKKWF